MKIPTQMIEHGERMYGEVAFRAAVLQLYNWQHTNSGCFSDILFLLTQKADPTNLGRLTLAFPVHMQAWSAWQASGDYGNDLFRHFKIGKFA